MCLISHIAVQEEMSLQDSVADSTSKDYPELSSDNEWQELGGRMETGHIRTTPSDFRQVA